MQTIKVARNARQKMDGLALLRSLEDRSAAAVFLDPQYREVLDQQAYGNEGQRQQGRADLPQMDGETIAAFVKDSIRVVRSSGYLFLWLDKYLLFSGDWHKWFPDLMPARLVDGAIWDKETFGMGTRFRATFEALAVVQKGPVRGADTWRDHAIRDLFRAKPDRKRHPHAKPIPVIERLIKCVTEPGDVVVDPCAGGYAVLDACRATGRTFVGCDLI